MIPTRRAPPATWLLLAAFLSLPGCGSDDDPATEPPVATTASVVAVDDAATVAWNEAATIDVLANDKTSSGALSLSATGTAAHGTASIAGDKLSYTPAAGYIGSDTVTYTVRAADGGATATASVAIAVQAKMRLSGLATDGPIAGAAVTVKVGDAEFSTTADANGNYTVDVTSADPAAFVTVVATGTGAQAGVKLISLAGDVAGLAAKASPAGLVASADVPALNATHLSTALAVLAARATAEGKMPANAAELSQATALVSGNELLRLATFVRLVADKGVPLPAGVNDTLALLQDRAKLEAFASVQLVDNATQFYEVQTEVLAQAPSEAQLDGLASAQDQTLVYLSPYAFGNADTIVTYRKDGAASVSYGRSRYEGRWVRNGATLNLTLNSPFKFYGTSALDEAFNQYTTQDTVTGMTIQHHSGDIHTGTASVALIGSQVYVDGPKAGQVTPGSADIYGVANALGAYVDAALRLEIEAADVAVGARLGGLLSALNDPSSSQPVADVLRVDTASTGTLEVAHEAVTWTLSDRWLTVTRANGDRVRHARLLRNAATGQETWFAVAEVGGEDGGATTSTVVRADPGSPKFDAPTVARTLFYADSFADSPDFKPTFRLDPDGTGLRDGVSPLQWTIDAQGRITVQLFRSGSTTLRSERRWTLLKAFNGNLIVLEYLRFYSGESVFETSRVRWLADL